MQNKSESLKKLFRRIENDTLLLPDFQRDFVWDRSKQKTLIASLFSGIPIGAYLTSNSKEGFSTKYLGTNEYFEANSDVELLLDGQQRVTTLFNALSDIFPHLSNKTGKTVDEVFDRLVFNELKSRWFIDLKEDLFGLKYFDSQCFSNIHDVSTEFFVDSIVCLKDLKSGGQENGYGIGIDINDLKSFCQREVYLPLFIFNSAHNSEIKIILESIMTNQLSKVSLFCDQECQEFISKHNLNITIEEFKSQYSPTSQSLMGLGYSWLLNAQKFFESILDENQILIHLEKISKVTEAFNYLNRGGVKLSNFDLFCSKFATLGVRKLVNEFISNEKTRIAKDAEFVEFLYSDLAILDGADIDSSFSEFLVQVFSLYHLYENNNVQAIDLTVLKSQYFLEKIENDFFEEDKINSCVEIACEVTAFAYYHLGFRGVNKVPNKLSLIPLAWARITRIPGFEDYRKNNLLRAHYYTTIFNFFYDSHQNENCVKASNQLIQLIDMEPLIKNKYIQDIRSFVDDTLKFEKLALEGEEGVSSSIEINFLNFFIFMNSSGVQDFVNDPNKRINYDVSTEIHHIHPLSGFTQLSQSSKAIRKNKTHRMNSILNKTLISRDANREIGSLPCNNYLLQMPEVKAQIINDHYMLRFQLISITPGLGPYDPQDRVHQEISGAYRLRYDLLTNKLTETLTQWINNYN